MKKNKIYKVHPDIVYALKNDTLKIIYIAEDKNDVINIKGPASEVLQLIDGKRSVSQLKQEIDQKCKLVGKEEDF